MNSLVITLQDYISNDLLPTCINYLSSLDLYLMKINNMILDNVSEKEKEELMIDIINNKRILTQNMFYNFMFHEDMMSNELDYITKICPFLQPTANIRIKDRYEIVTITLFFDDLYDNDVIVVQHNVFEILVKYIHKLKITNCEMYVHGALI